LKTTTTNKKFPIEKNRLGAYYFEFQPFFAYQNNFKKSFKKLGLLFLHSVAKKRHQKIQSISPI